MSWKEAKRTLRKDGRSEVTDILSKEEREKMFSEHIEKLAFKKRGKFRYLILLFMKRKKAILFCNTFSL
jgi:transcription elongation regulator 1